MSDRRVIRCQECDRQISEMRNGLFIIRQKHWDFQKRKSIEHVTVFTFEQLREMMATAEADAQRAA